MVKVLLEKVTVKLNGELILDKINFCSDKPEVISLVGPNGSGKSTFIRTLLNLTEIENGKVSISINDSSQLKEIKKNIGLVIDTVGLYDSLSVYDNLEFYCNLLDIKTDQKQCIERALAKINLTEKKHKKVKTLSKGEKQRLSIARILLKEYELYIFDEPTLGLDYDANMLLCDLIKEWKSLKNKTVMLVSHDFDLVQKISDRVLFFKNKSIWKDESLEKVLGSEDSVEAWYKNNLREM